MKLTIEIEFGNDAMQRYSESTEAIAQAFKPGRRNMFTRTGNGTPSAGDGSHIKDENGNTVGKWEVSD